jgi:hypothetical protein
MTWYEAAIETAKAWGLEDDVKESYDKYIKDGMSESEAAHSACYDWDIYITHKMMRKVKKIDKSTCVMIVDNVT